jgi:4-hydroxy-2-oxoheptanedioate aldolase
MYESSVLKKMRDGKPVLCTKTNFNDPGIVELIGNIGFDCIWICREHLWSNDETVANMIKSARITGMDVMVRIDKASYPSAIRYMEMGTKGIMVPHVISVQEAKNWIKNTRFYPEGRRGVDGVNADSGWMAMGLEEYLDFSNKETFLAFEIEDPEAIPNIEEIAALHSLDIVFVGIGDLSVSMGFKGDIKRKEIWEVLEKVGKITGENGIFAGAPAGSAEDAKRLIDMGYLFISNGADIIYLRNSFLNLRNEYKKLGFLFNENKISN